LPSFPGLSLLAKTTAFFATSLGPISILNGTPFISHSLYFHPGVSCSDISDLTRIPDNFNNFSTLLHISNTACLSSSFCQIGTIIA
jgi:hypothetical protein